MRHEQCGLRRPIMKYLHTVQSFDFHVPFVTMMVDHALAQPLPRRGM